MPNEFIEKRDNDAYGRLEYYGQAEPGTRTSEAKWIIERYSYTGIQENDKKYPNGSNANAFAWTLRKTYVYS